MTLFDSNTTALNNAYLRIEEDKKQLRAQGLLSNNNFVVRINKIPSVVNLLQINYNFNLIPICNYVDNLKSSRQNSGCTIVLLVCSM